MAFITSSSAVAEPPPVAAQKSSSAGVIILLLLLVAVAATDLFFRFEERQFRLAAEERRIADESSRKSIIDAAVKASQEIEKKRIEVFTEYVKDLGSYETKSVYHQIYHANNAQLKMQNLAVEEHALLIQILSAKR